MDLMQEVKGYSDREEEEEEEEAGIIIGEESSSKLCPLSSSSSPSLSSPSSTNYKSRHHIIPPHHQNLWLGMLHDHNHHHHSPEATTTTTHESHNSSSGLGLHHQQQDSATTNFIEHRKQLDFMDLSLGSSKDDEANFYGACGGSHHRGSSSSTTTTNSGSNNNHDPVEKEHMFDKVVTPSDVGKLNRLVIPKQHAEKYFPLDSSTNEKGLLLNFEDRNGKLWRFRYSYWNSSQSYVMTKGWSRFVKDKKLDAGDIVSFHRGVGELYRHRLFIDWRRRPDHVVQASDHPTLITPLFLPNQPHYSIRWGGRLYSLPSPASLEAPRHHEHLQHLNYSNMYPFHQQPHHRQQQHIGGSYPGYNELNSGSGSVYYLRSTHSSMGGDQNLMGQRQEGGNGQMIIDAVPVAHHQNHHQHGKSGSGSSRTAGKRLRLFGVNMECASSSSSSPTIEESKCCLLSSSTTTANSSSLPSSTSSLQQYLRVPHHDVHHDVDPLSSSSARFADQRGETAMLFDLDPSLQYRQ